MHIQDPDQKSWIQRRVEGAPWRTAFDAKAKRTILRAAHRGGRLRGVLPEALRHHQALRPGGRRGHHSRAARDHRDGGRAGRGRDRHRHAASRPAQHAGQHREEAVHRGVLRVRRRELQAGRCAGLGRREVPPRHLDRRGDRRAQRAPLAAAQPVASGGGRSRRGRQGARAPGHRRRHAAAVLGDGDPDARRRGVRRPGPGVRDAGDEPAHRLPHRRHDPPGRQQPDRLHHRPGARLFRPLLHRCREVDPGADPARQRRRPRGGDVLRAHGGRVPHALRRRHRAGHRLLSPPRPQRDRRAGLHPADDVSRDQPARRPRARSTPNGWRPRAWCRAAEAQAMWDEFQAARWRTANAGGAGLQAEQGGLAGGPLVRLPCRRTPSSSVSEEATAVAADDAEADRHGAVARAGRLRGASAHRPPARSQAGDARDAARASTGRPARRWRSARCCWRAAASACPARTASAARSASAMPC